MASNSKIFRAVVIAAVAVSSFTGVALAADEPAPTSGAAALSSSLVAAVLCPAVAFLVASMRH